MEALYSHEPQEAPLRRLDPALEAAPGAAAERRLHGRAHAYWRSLLGAQRFPLIDDLDLAGVPRLAETSLLFAVQPVGGEPEVHLVGAAIREAWREPEGEMARLIAQVRLRLPVLAAHRKPLGFEAELAGIAAGDTAYRGILLPFGRTGETVDYVLMVVSWKERSTIERDPAVLAAGAYAARPGARCLIDSPWNGADTPDHAILPSTTVTQKLATARMWAELATAEQGGHRTHADKAATAAYTYFVAQDALTPLAVVDSVFGPLDRGARCDHAAALRFARRLCLSPELFHALLADVGGVAEVAAMEWRVRRAQPSLAAVFEDHFRLTEPVGPRDRSASPWRGREAEPIAVEHPPLARAAKD